MQQPPGAATYVHGLLFGFSQFTGSIDRLVVGSFVGSANVQGDLGALTAAQKRGLKLFIGKAACSDCHNGPTFTDNQFHNIGAPNVSIVPGNMANQAFNRGRATAVAAQVAQLTALDIDAENPLVFNGAGRWSA